MPKFDIEKRNFIKSILMAIVMAFFIEFGGLQRLVFGQAVAIGDNFGVLYSTATGIVLRTINPGPGEQAHLDWLDNNKPTGTTLLRLNKMALGADNFNVPNLDTVIPYVQKNNSLALLYGVPCVIINALNAVTATVLCCPILYGQVVTSNALGTLIQKSASVGDIYNPITQIFTKPVSVTPSL